MIQKLSFAEKFGYGLGDMAANFIFQAMLALQLSYYTDTFGLSAAQAGTLFLVVGLIAAAFNPIMGVIADRTNTKWGKFRPWLLWTAVPFGIIGVLTFTTPSLSPTGKIIYAWTTYLLLRLIYAVNNVPYASLTGVLTGDPDERTSIASYRQIFANSAGFIVQSLAIPMVVFFGHGNDARGYQITMGLLSVLSVIFFIVAFFATKERIQPNPQQQTSLTRDLKDLFSNRPWVVLFLVTTFYFAAIAMRGSVMLPYFKYLAGNEKLFSWFNGFGLASLIAGVTVSTALTQRIGKRPLFILSMTLCGVFNLAVLVLPPHATVAIIVSEVLRQFCLRNLRPAHLGHDGRRCRLRRVEDRPPRHRNCNSGGGLCSVGRSRHRRRHRRLALLVLRLRLERRADRARPRRHPPHRRPLVRRSSSSLPRSASSSIQSRARSTKTSPMSSPAAV